jgi:NADPH-dependent glutamate synthase beta subunit-like oxidoreductase
MYSAIIYAHGASSSDKELKIIGGENTKSARKFVEWYNGMPESESFELSSINKIGIIGNGNVAMDVSRILSVPIEHLSNTDISWEALDVLSTSNVKEIDIYGRRGAVQAAMSVKELRYLSKVPGISIRVFEDEISKSVNANSIKEGSIDSVQVTQQQRARKRLFDLINSFPRQHNPDARVKINLRFLLSPLEYLDKSLKMSVNELQGPVYSQHSVETDKFLINQCDLAIRSIGYSSIQIDEDLPFNYKEGIVENLGGRVSPNCYVTGWARTGPFGVIDTTMRNVFVSVMQQTIDCIIQDYYDQKITETLIDAKDLLKCNYITFPQWLKIDRYEIQDGSSKGKCREKIKSIKKMLEVALN